MSTSTRHISSLVLMAWALAPGAAVAAVTSVWSANVDGNFNDATKWTNGVPGTGMVDTALFNLGITGIVTVTFPGDLIFNPTRTYIHDRLVVDNLIDVTFARNSSHLVGPAHYELTNPTTAPGGERGITVGDSPLVGFDNVGPELVTELASLSAKAVTLGNQTGSKGNLSVNGGVLNVTGDSAIAGDNELLVGYHGGGVLSIQTGGQVNVTGDHGDVEIGDSVGSLVDILGAGSVLNVQGAHSHFDVHIGNVEVNGGAQLDTASSATISPTSRVQVLGTGSTWTASGAGIFVDGNSSSLGELEILGGTVTAPAVGGTGFFSVDGATATLSATTMNVANVSLTNGGQLSNVTATLGGGQASITGMGAKWTTTGALAISGGQKVNVSGGGQLASGSGLVGNLAGGSSTVVVDGAGSTWTLSGDLTVGSTSASTLKVSTGGSVSTSGQVTIGPQGTLAGNGTIVATAVQNAGVVSPGNSPGVLHINGNYSQTVTGKLGIELNGTMLGVDYDQLAVTGVAALGGALDVSLGYSPHAGDAFDILDWGSRMGAFAAIHLPSPAGLRWNISQLYTTGMLSLVAVRPGDFDEDGFVTLTDYALWKGGFGTASGATHLQGDANSDGRVDAADYTIWRDELGQSAAGAGGSSRTGDVEAVPEAETLVQFVVGMISVWTCARRRR
jgi:T5SS/PEP-CTERM-associated repeat protein